MNARAEVSQPELTLSTELGAMADRVRGLVPDLVGVSVGVRDGAGVILTLVASAEVAAALDALQYLDGGPCVEDVERGQPLEVDLRAQLDEGRWLLYARGAAVLGVGSSLSIPIASDDRVMGGVNLYAAGGDSFRVHHDQVAATIGAELELAVVQADLSLWTAKAAMAAPSKVREGDDLNVALGLISATHGVNIPVARQRLRNTAARAGLTEAQMAGVLKQLRAH